MVTVGAEFTESYPESLRCAPAVAEPGMQEGRAGRPEVTPEDPVRQHRAWAGSGRAGAGPRNGAMEGVLGGGQSLREQNLRRVGGPVQQERQFFALGR
jgi:hypothetical protein